MQGAQHRARGIPLDDQPVARKPAPGFYDPVHARVVERPDHDVHRLGHQRMSEGAKLPIAEVSGGKQNSPAAFFGVQEIVQAFVTYELVYVFAAKLWKTREDPDEARDGEKNFVGDLAAFRKRLFRIRQLQVPHGGAAQAGNGKIQKLDVEAG